MRASPAPDPAAMTGSFADRLQNIAVRGLIGAALALPFTWRVRAFGWLTARGIAPLTKLGPRIDENLSFIYPEMPVAARKRLGRLSADRTGRLMIELYSWRDLDRRMAHVTPTGPGWPVFLEATDAGRPILLMTGHFGNYLAARACLIRRGHAIGGFYRPMENRYFNRHYLAAMAATGGPVFPDTASGTKGLIRFLRRGGAAMLLNDLYIGSGVDLPFLGQPAMTSTSPAEIAARTNALMIPIWGVRRADGVSFTVELDAPLPLGDATEATRAYNAAVEARIRADPAQWFWMHRRWKRKWNKGRALGDDLHPAQLPKRRSRL
ncbi:MAG: lysophospholipid acyltransferase family protein [Pseudomonadota bacterium]